MEDIAYSLDKEIYKSVMEMQGLEYDLSPGRRKNGKKARRKKKVTFALDENHKDRDENYHDCHHNDNDYNNTHRKGYGEKNQVVPKIKGPIDVAPKTPRKGSPQKSLDPTNSPAQSLASAFDLSLWENRDPEMDIVDMSFSSGENNESINHDDQSSSFDISSSSLEATTPSTFQAQIDDQKKKEDSVVEEQDFDGDVFNSIDNDDGWESFQDSSSSDFMWPEMDSLHSSNTQLSTGKEQGSDQVMTAHNLVKQSQQDQNEEEIGDDESERSSDFESIGDDLYAGLDISLEDNLPFVEKIARENIYRGINELGEEEEDSDAADSWEQNDSNNPSNDDDDDIIDDNSQTMNLSLGSAISMEGSITAVDVHSEEEGEEEECEIEDVSNTDEHLNALHEEFMIEYDGDDNQSEDSDDSDDGEHNKFVREMTESEFADEILPCDSSGADKTVYTIGTAETEAMTADDDSEGSKSDEDQNEEPVIGISRRDSYYPSFDSPQRNEMPSDAHDKTVMPIKLDYLEYKVKDLQVKQESRVKSAVMEAPCVSDNNEISCSGHGSVNLKPRISVKPPYPVQMARTVSKEVVLPNSSNEENSEKAPPQSAPVKATKNVEKSLPNESSRPHPTAARIKNLKKTAAWKRRFGKQ